ncbi:hypothetical protein PL11201_330053 [Planktothrix sp. PCC 11201]|nr:hypothetical protein PL11201_330053 [Planktothrix sp. PCC 11201]
MSIRKNQRTQTPEFIMGYRRLGTSLRAWYPNSYAETRFLWSCAIDDFLGLDILNEL